MVDMVLELRALAEAFVAYGQPYDAQMCWQLIDRIKMRRERQETWDAELLEAITNISAFTEQLAEQSCQIDRLQQKLDDRYELLMTYNARNMLLKQALAEVLACQNCRCEECKATLRNALTETARMHVKMEGPTP